MSRSLIVRAVAVLMVALSGVLLAPALASAESAQVLGAESRVWDYTNDRCDDGHYPDQPARAFRRSNGQVTLTISSSFFNGRMLGPSLNTVVGV